MKARPLFLFLFFVLGLVVSGPAQQSVVDSLEALLAKPIHDTAKINVLDELINELGPTEAGKKYNQQMGALGKTLMFNSDTAIAKVGANAYASYLGNSGFLAELSGDVAKALQYYREAYPIMRSVNDNAGVASIYNNIAVVYANIGDFPKAIVYHDSALVIREKYGLKEGIASTLNNLATIYRDQGEVQKALDYFRRFLSICREVKDSSGIGLGLNNIGNLYVLANDTARGRLYLDSGLAVNKKIGDNRGIGLSLFGLGGLYFKGGNYTLARQYYEEALANQEAAGHKSGTINTTLKLAETYDALGETELALSTATKAHELALKTGYIALLQNSSGTLKELYRKSGRYEEALTMYELEVKMRDSLKNESNRNILMRSELEHEYNKKAEDLKTEQEKADLRVQKNTAIRNIALAGLGLVLVFLFFVIKQRNRISRERKRSDDLLLNILPSEVADELKEKGYAETKSFDEVTILFTDFKGFTLAAEKIAPQELVAELDVCFKAFDSIMEKYYIEKIKTIGDSYMAVGGLPVPSATHALDVVRAAMEINAFMNSHRTEQNAKGRETFEIRIGIHTGPVVAGIVGVKKFAYDIWGDTVNTASRMESSGEAGKVNISETTYRKIQDQFNCTYRGKIEAKNKGEVAMYFVDGPKN